MKVLCRNERPAFSTLLVEIEVVSVLLQDVSSGVSVCCNDRMLSELTTSDLVSDILLVPSALSVLFFPFDFLDIVSSMLLRSSEEVSPLRSE